MDDLILTHRVASYECGPDMLLKPEGFMHFCQEMAELHASLNNLGYEWGVSHNLIWVETQGDYQFIRRPKWKEVVSLRTNTGKASPLQARRFVEMTDEDGQVIARADLMWVLIGIDTRRPMPLKRVQLELAEDCPPIISAPMSPAGEMEGEEEKSRFPAPKRDVDFNGHINNGAYLAWALENMPDGWGSPGSPSRFRIAYKHESHAGDAISILSQRAGSQTLHRILCGDELRAELVIDWK